jgi:hypothetical protein
MTKSSRGKVPRVTKTHAGGTMKKGLDPVAAYLRFRLERLIGEEPGQIAAKAVAERVGLSESAISQFRSGAIGMNQRHYPAFAKLLRIRGNPDEAAKSLVRDAVEWYGCLVEGTLPILGEPAVQQAIALVAQSERVSPKVIEGLLARFGNSAFLGREQSYWVRTLSEELRRDIAAERDIAANDE